MPQDAPTPDRSSGKPRWLGFAQLALILLVIAGALYLARAPSRVEHQAAASSAQAQPVVNVVKPAATEHTIQVDLTGTVTLQGKVTVVSEVVGRVVWVSPDFVNGGSIPANETFIRVDPTEYQLEVQAAEMAVAEAEALLLIAKANAGEGAAPSIAPSEARLGKARAALALAELQLARTEISLPFAGRVVTTDLEVGDLVGPSEAVGRQSVLGVVYRSDAVQVYVPIKMDELASLTPAIGRPAKVRTVTGVYDAKVARVSSVVAIKTRMAKVFLEFADGAAEQSRPVPGTFAQVRILGPERGNVFVLPESAARERDSLWVVRDGALRSFTPRTVGRTAGRTSGRWIVEAFDAGDGVVVSTLSGSREGLKVTAKPASSSQ